MTDNNTSGLCKYANLFGAPGTGAHRFRIFNIAIVDVTLTIIGAYVVHIFFLKKYIPHFWATLLFAFILGIIVHRLFCVRTTIDKLLFP